MFNYNALPDDVKVRVTKNLDGTVMTKTEINMMMGWEDDPNNTGMIKNSLTHELFYENRQVMGKTVVVANK